MKVLKATTAFIVLAVSLVALISTLQRQQKHQQHLTSSSSSSLPSSSSSSLPHLPPLPPLPPLMKILKTTTAFIVLAVSLVALISTLQRQQKHQQHLTSSSSSLLYSRDIFFNHTNETYVPCENIYDQADPCQFVIDHCKPESGRFDYLKFHVCTAANYPILSMGFLIVLFLLLFLYLGSAANDFFVPSLNVIVAMLKLPEDVAGVTFVALGNGAPDVFSSFSAISGSQADVGLSLVLGMTAFVAVFVLGLLFAKQKFPIEAMPFHRDSLMLLGSIVVFFGFLVDEKIVLWESILLVLCYILYVTIVASTPFMKRSYKKWQDRKLLVTPGGDYAAVPTLVVNGDGDGDDDGDNDDDRHHGKGTSPNIFVSNNEDAPPFSSDPSPSYYSEPSYPPADPTTTITISDPHAHHTGYEDDSDHHNLQVEHIHHQYVSHHHAVAGGNIVIPPAGAEKVTINLDEMAQQPSGRVEVEVITLKEALFPAFFSRYDPLSGMSWFGKITTILKIPITFAMALTVPVLAYCKEDDDEAEAGPVDEKEKVPEASIGVEVDESTPFAGEQKQNFLAIPTQTRQRSASIRSEAGVSMIATVDDNGDMVYVYNRTLIGLQLLLLPAFVTMLLIQVDFTEMYVYLLCVAVGIICVVITFLVFDSKRAPKYFELLAFVGFFATSVWLFVLADELVGLLVTIGRIWNINDAILGVTVLAWGNSVGDVVVLLTVASKQKLTMALSAVFAAPVFSLLVGLGVIFLIETVSEPLLLPASPILSLAFITLTAALVLYNVLVPLWKYNSNRIFGGVLMLMYVAFLVLSVLAELYY